MRILSTPPTSQYPLAPFLDVPELPRHREARPTTYSTTVGAGYTAATSRSQRPPHATIVHLASGGARTSSSSLPHMQYSPEFCAAPPTMTMQQPPPLDFKKSPYRCIPLPNVARGPVNISSILAYTDGRRAYNGRDDFQGQSVNDDHYMDAPATNPTLGSITILLPNSRGVTVHASLKKHSFVTVGDVLDALDKVLPMEAAYGHGGRSCDRLSGTKLRSLRCRYKRAGMTRSAEGFDVWDFLVG